MRRHGIAATALLLAAAALPGQAPVHDWRFDAAGLGALRGAIRGPGQVLAAPLPPAMVFRDRDDRVVVARSIRNAGLPRQAITVEAWAMLDHPRAWGGLFSALQDNGGFEQGVLLGYRGNRFCFALASQGSDDGDGKLTYLTGSSGFVAGRFQHVVGVYDGARMQLFVDGRLEATSTAQRGAILYPRRAVVELGAYHDDDEDFPFAGLLGAVRVWDRALPAAEVQRRCQDGRARFAMPTTAQPRSWQLTAGRQGLGGQGLTVLATGPVRFEAAAGIAALELTGDTRFRTDWPATAAAGWSAEVTFATGANRRRQTLLATAGIELSILDGKLRAAVGDAEATVGVALQPYRWQHAAATFDGSLLRVYLDGQARASARTRQPPPTPGGTLEIGAGMIGRLHQVRFANRAWTADEVAARFRGQSTAFPQPLRLALGPYAEFRDPTTARVRWRGPADARQAWVEVTDTAGRLQRVSVRTRDGLSIADITRLQPGDQYDCRVVIEGADGRQGTTDPFRLDTEMAWPTTDLRPTGTPPAEFAALLGELPVHKGYAVVLAGDAAVTHRLTMAVLAQTALQVVVVADRPAVVAELRRRFVAERVYGPQVSVLHAALDRLPVGSDLANAVLLATDAAVPHAELQRVARPHGGVVLRLDGSAVLRKGRVAGAGDWTHQYGSAANTAASDDALVGGALELQWFGRPGPRPMMDRGARSPAPLATNGRLFIHGDRRLITLDAYNGTILWSLEIPALRRTNVPRDCSNLAAEGDALYAAVVDRLWQLDAQTGRLRRTYPIPADLRPAEDAAWGFVHATADTVIGTATRLAATYRGAEGEWYDKPGADAEDVLGAALFALDKATGKPVWSYRRGAIVHPTITIDKDVLYFVEDRKPSPASLRKGRLVDQTGTDQYLVAIELPTGHQVWERRYDFRKFQQAFYLSASGGVLVAVGTAGAYHVHAFDSSTGAPLWQHSHKWKRDHHGGGLQHPVIIGDTIYVEFKGISLREGKVVRDDLPDRRGCGTMSGSGRSLFFRHYDQTMWDLETDARITLPGIRSGCWLSLIPAGGLLLAPESSSGCSCADPIQTSVAYRPRAAK